MRYKQLKFYGHAVGEPARVVTLPAKRRVHDHDLRAHVVGQLDRAVDLGPRVRRPPDPLADQQGRRVDRQDRHAVLVRVPAQDPRVLRERVPEHHHLDAVVAEPRGGREPGLAPERVDRRARQGHPDSGAARVAGHGAQTTETNVTPTTRARDARASATRRSVTAQARGRVATSGWRRDGAEAWSGMGSGRVRAPGSGPAAAG